MAITPFREKLSDAIRFWEIRRIFYNLWLAAIVCFYFLRFWPASKSSLQLDALLWLFMMAVLANVAYCAAYPVDVFVQMSGLRETWRSFRWVLLMIGMILAGIFTRWFAMALFAIATST
ncbi:MAG TPA: hypothetical protein VH724_19375 [Candidatus Angelobacter sp.]|nr:hypothetical protein [Candidatus Angelobacter sp.]